MRLPHIPGFDRNALLIYLKNTGWLVLARVGSLIIKIFVGFAIANYLGKSQNGLLNYPIAFSSFFIAIAAMGLDNFIVRELLRNPENENKLLGTAFGLKLIGGIFMVPLMLGTYYLLFYGGWSKIPISFILIISFVGIIQSFNIIDSYFQSKIKGKQIMFVQIAGNILSAFIKLVAIYLKLSILWFVLTILMDAFLLSMAYLIIYHNQIGNIKRWQFDSSLAKQLLKNSWPLAFAAILVSIYMKIDQLMIESYLGSAALGVYSTVVSLSESWYFIPVAIVSSVFPAIMNAKKDNEERYQKRLQNLYDLMVWLSLSVAIIMSVASPYIYQLFYKPEYGSGATVLSLHVWAGIFVFLGSASGQFLIAEGLTKLAMLRTAIGALINIILNIFWIPRYGIAGAAFATIIAYFFATFTILFNPKTKKQGLMMLKSLFLITLINKIKKH